MKIKARFFILVIPFWLNACSKDDNATTATPKPLVNKLFGGSNSDYFSTVAVTTDGGSIMAGSTFSFNGDIVINHGNFDGFIVKVNAIGDPQWIKTYGGPGYDYINKIISIPDGGYLIAGIAANNDGDYITHNGSYDAWIARLDNMGNVLWSKAFGGSDGEGAQDLIITPDGGYLFAGYSSSKDGDAGNTGHGSKDGWIVKLSSTGTIQWSKMVGGAGEDLIFAITPAPDGTFLLAGETDSKDGDINKNAGQQDGFLAKVNKDGILLWTKTYGGSAAERLNAVINTPDGEFIAAGFSASNNDIITGAHGDKDIWIVKINASGDLRWNKMLGGSAIDFAASLIKTPDNNYMIAATSNSNNGDATGNNGDYDALLIKFNNKGEKIWNKSLGSQGYDAPYALISMPDNKYILAGSSPDPSSAGWFLKFE